MTNALVSTEFVKHLFLIVNESAPFAGLDSIIKYPVISLVLDCKTLSCVPGIAVITSYLEFSGKTLSSHLKRGTFTFSFTELGIIKSFLINFLRFKSILLISRVANSIIFVFTKHIG